MENQPETPLKLKWYERIIIDSNKKLVGKSTNGRVVAIDWWKGFSITWLTFYHLGIWWLFPQDMWLARLQGISMWFVGPTTFLLFAGINVTLSYRIGREKNIPFKKLYLETFRRMLGVLVVSTGWNLINTGGVSVQGLSMFFRWEILQCIIFSTLLVFPLLKLSILPRFLIACFILVVSYPLYLFIAANQSSSIIAQFLSFIMFDPYLTCPLFPTIAITIIGTIVVDVIYPIIKQKGQVNWDNVDPQSQTQSIKRTKSYWHFKILLVLSLITILLCILFGSGPNLEPLFQAEATISLLELQTNPLLASLPYIPDFLVRLSPINYIYDLACATFFFLLAFYYFTILKPKNYEPSKFSQITGFFGQYSLSYFTFGYIFAIFGTWANPVTIWFGFVMALTVLTLIFKLLLRKAYGGGLIEWLMMVFSIKWSALHDIKDIRAVYPEKFNELPANHSEEKRR